MSRPRYAPITSSLLVRKGEARPWQMPGSELAEPVHDAPPHHFTDEERHSEVDYHEWRRAREAELASHSTNHANGYPHQVATHALTHGHHHEYSDDHTRRCTLRLTPSEYERLGIIGVKREMTRQQMLRHALDLYLAQAKTEYKAACGCLSSEECRQDC